MEQQGGWVIPSARSVATSHASSAWSTAFQPAAQVEGDASFGRSSSSPFQERTLELGIPSLPLAQLTGSSSGFRSGGAPPVPASASGLASALGPQASASGAAVEATGNNFSSALNLLTQAILKKSDALDTFRSSGAGSTERSNRTSYDQFFAKAEDRPAFVPLYSGALGALVLQPTTNFSHCNEGLKEIEEARREAAHAVDDLFGGGASQVEVLELIFDKARFDAVDLAEFRVGIDQGLRELGAHEEDLDQLVVNLRPGSIIAQVSGPAVVIGRLSALDLDKLTVCGFTARLKTIDGPPSGRGPSAASAVESGTAASTPAARLSRPGPSEVNRFAEHLQLTGRSSSRNSGSARSSVASSAAALGFLMDRQREPAADSASGAQLPRRPTPDEIKTMARRVASARSMTPAQEEMIAETLGDLADKLFSGSTDREAQAHLAGVIANFRRPTSGEMRDMSGVIGERCGTGAEAQARVILESMSNALFGSRDHAPSSTSPSGLARPGPQALEAIAQRVVSRSHAPGQEAVVREMLANLTDSIFGPPPASQPTPAAVEAVVEQVASQLCTARSSVWSYSTPQARVASAQNGEVRELLTNLCGILLSDESPPGTPVSSQR